jgi:hypothetical protein
MNAPMKSLPTTTGAKQPPADKSTQISSDKLPYLTGEAYRREARRQAEESRRWMLTHVPIPD